MKATTLELMQLAFKEFLKPGHLLVAPHGRLIFEGKKTALLKKRKFDLTKPQWLVSEGKVWGVLRTFPPERLSVATLLTPRYQREHRVSKEEIRKWWGDVRELWFYRIRDFIPYGPERVRVPRGVQGPIRRVVVKQEDPYLVYPPGDRPVPYVIQADFLKKSVHADLRIIKVPNRWAVGYTWLVQVPGTITEDVEDLSDAKKWIDNPRVWKIDWKKGVFRERRIRPGVIRRAQIRTILKKVKIDAGWLKVHGVRERFLEPGEKEPARRRVYYIIDKGLAYWAAIKGDFHEFYLLDGKMRGRFVVRAIPRVEQQILPPGVVPERVIAPVFWTTIQPDDQRPYVLSRRAVEIDWLPPRGISAIPPKIRRAIPRELQFWRFPRAKALKVRAELIERVEELNLERLWQLR